MGTSWTSITTTLITSVSLYLKHDYLQMERQWGSVWQMNIPNINTAPVFNQSINQFICQVIFVSVLRWKCLLQLMNNCYFYRCTCTLLYFTFESVDQSRIWLIPNSNRHTFKNEMLKCRLLNRQSAFTAYTVYFLSLWIVYVSIILLQ